MVSDEGETRYQGENGTRSARAARAPRAKVQDLHAVTGEARNSRPGEPREEGASEGETSEWRKGVSDGLRKAIASGIRTVFSADDLIREGLPRDVVGYVVRQTDTAKDEIVRMVGVQLRKFFDNIDIAGELQKILTSVSFEIKTEIRFIPNDQAVIPRARIRVSRGRKDKGSKPDEASERPGVSAEPARGVVAPEPGERHRRTRLGAAVDRALGVFQRDGDSLIIEDELDDGSTSTPRRGQPTPAPNTRKDNGAE